MWTDGVRNYYRTLLCVTLAWALCGATGSAAQEGQYRSRILLLPDGAWAKGTDMSVEELEQQLGSIEDAYARSGASRHLARHYLQRKEYDQAIKYYKEALNGAGLSPVANREMLRELAQAYLLQQDYTSAEQSLQQVLAMDLVADVADYLLLARAQHHQGRYVEVVATLDRMKQAGVALDAKQMRQALALYYRAGAYAQCELLLHGLLEIQPDEARHWHLLASVYLQQNKKKQALDQLALAWDKRVPFTEQDVLLLANLQAAHDNPFGAAQTLDAALTQGTVAANGIHYRKLFEFWLQAREQEKARAALQQAAHLSGETELYLHLAQLHMEEQDFQAMQATLLAACAKQLADPYVGRANLLLGISQLKLGDTAGARRSFINASLIGGVNAQAGQWLRFMQAAPASEDETRRIVSVCHGSRDQRLDVGSSVASQPPASGPAAGTGGAAGADAFEVKTVPPLRLYYTEYDQPLAKLADSLRGAVISMNINLVKSGGAADGPLHLLFNGDVQEPGAGLAVQLALPARGPVSGQGKFRLRTTQPFRCAYLTFRGPGQALPERLAALAAAVRAAAHELTGEARIVIPAGDSTGTLQFELQLGIRE